MRCRHIVTGIRRWLMDVTKAQKCVKRFYVMAPSCSEMLFCCRWWPLPQLCDNNLEYYLGWEAETYCIDSQFFSCRRQLGVTLFFPVIHGQNWQNYLPLKWIRVLIYLLQRKLKNRISRWKCCSTLAICFRWTVPNLHLTRGFRMLIGYYRLRLHRDQCDILCDTFKNAEMAVDFCCFLEVVWYIF